MTTFQKCEQLKIERRTASPERQEQIDTMVKRLEPFLSEQDAACIVRAYESGLRRSAVKVDGMYLHDMEPYSS